MAPSPSLETSRSPSATCFIVRLPVRVEVLPSLKQVNRARCGSLHFGEQLPEPIVGPEYGPNPEHEALLADSVGLALLVVLETLTPAERVALVLHDMFAVPFAEIAPIVGRSSASARQLASRARRRVR